MTVNSVTSGPRARIDFTSTVPAQGVVYRRSVLATLSSPGTRVAAVLAPGGYGKTTHVAAWLREQIRPVAWVDIDESLDDPRPLMAAFCDALASVTDFDAAGLQSGGAVPAQYTTLFAPQFGDAVRRCARPFTLVLDDVHLLSSPSTEDVLDALASNVPDGSTVVLIGRAAPTKSVHRLRADPGFVEISAASLALDGDEIVRVLVAMGVPTAEIDATQVLADTEGWPVGVRLAGARWIADARDHGAARLTITGRDPTIAEYVSGEWLSGLNAEQRDFLLAVSCVDWLSGPLCNAIVGRNDSGELLYRIFQDRKMLIPLDRRAEAYRMHPLLREALRAEYERVNAVGARVASMRASEWFEESGDIDRAVGQAQLAGDIERVARLIVDSTPLNYTNGHYAVTRRWLEAMPREHVLRSSSLCLCAAMAALGLGDSDATKAWLRVSEQIGSSALATDESHQRLVVFRTLMSCGPVTQSLAEVIAARRALPPGLWHASSCLALGALHLAADIDGAEDVLIEGAEEAAIFGGSSVEAGCRSLLAVVALAKGDIAQASAYARAARRILVERDLEQRPSLALVIGVSALLEAVEGDSVRARADVALSRSNLAYLQGVSSWTNVQTRFALTRASLRLDDWVGADVLLNEARAYLESRPDAIGELRECAELEEMVRASRGNRLAGPSSLTAAELRVLHHLPTNLMISDIGSRLFLSRFTVKTHCSAIYRKLGVSSRAEAVEVARAGGLLPAPDSRTTRD
jgi:LuxR family maltose regulon positive regulatory protein